VTAGAGAAAARAYLSIGEVLAELRPDFPDTTISKLRYLESEGLVDPQRTQSGYRKYSLADVERLRYVLSAQRDRYLPLRVIREQLDAMDRDGLWSERDTRDRQDEYGASVPRRLHAVADPGSSGPTSADSTSADLTSADSMTGPARGTASVPAAAELRLSRQELIEAAELSAEEFGELERAGLLGVRSDSHYDGDALAVARAARQLGRYGLQARHLRAYRVAADREVGLFEQVITPVLRQRDGQARGRAEEMVRDLATQSERLHAALVRAGLRAALGD
jgi:DNA-binding transcriptional MerR regulator